jgi:hypothetical protein
METKGLSEYVAALYNISDITNDELALWNDAYSYKGFDRKKVMIDLMKKVPDVKIAQQIVLICGLLGPQRAANMKLLNGRTVSSYGIPASGLKGNAGVSCQRVTAATADLCAFLLKKINPPKRLNLPCPSWLQFPSAGSIALPSDLREMHIDFARRFSTVIGGQFNEQIYMQMVNNSYLEPNLGLFETPTPVSVSSTGLVPPPATTFNPAKGDVGKTKTDQTSRKPQ